MKVTPAILFDSEAARPQLFLYDRETRLLVGVRDWVTFDWRHAASCSPDTLRRWESSPKCPDEKWWEVVVNKYIENWLLSEGHEVVK